MIPLTLLSFTPDAAAWDAFVLRQPRAHVLQTAAWGALKSAFGWRAAIVALRDSNDPTHGIVGGALLLFRALPFRLGSMAYLPMGGFVTDPAYTSDLWNAIDRAARKHGAAFLKWEPGIYLEDSPELRAVGIAPETQLGFDTLPDPIELAFRRSPQTVQPPRTIIIDIARDDEAILARMNQGTRRKIRQSLKNGIEYREATRVEVDHFTGMMQTTGARNEFGVHEPDYYRRAYALFVPRDAALIMAYHEGEPLAGVFVFAAGRTAWYLYGASSNEKRNLMAAYGVQWKAIAWAKARGCLLYDLWGIPDEDEAALEAGFETQADGLWGVYGFKRGWGGAVVRSVGALDRVYNPIVYAAYGFALRRRGLGTG